ncbi:NAD(+) diphosphatase [Pontixanthobacter gangjinensis]|uniref:NAD(+) diphosphatase n=1 Tax=Pontixanthobacter gangjinensis TaxID=1028742 RepID=A0A6I4SLL3_9SPHN|nr:NAD(+) diphosphatase [Pontixanthobacter gangjinensis]MXO56564.1 NAD(+) diphosphatase [Pontixanthobacter gangjinensis]
MNTKPLAFTGSRLDRADNIRADADALAALTNWRARLLLLDGLMPRMDDHGALAWGTLADAVDDAELVFLGLDEGKACFAAVPQHGDARPRMANPALWAAMQALSPDDLAIYGGARSVTDWHARHRFCAACGGPTKLAKGGWQRTCSSCNTEHFPRTDPVTIMLVEHDGKLLLGRGLGWPDRAYSALAGFVEPGESIEEAVAREVLEESGITVSDVSYIASQPWPFPSQLMIGCHATATSEDITIDTTELADVRWFTRAEVQAAMDGDVDAPMNTPPPHAIANYLLKWWLERV